MPTLQRMNHCCGEKIYGSGVALQTSVITKISKKKPRRSNAIE